MKKNKVSSSVKRTIVIPDTHFQSPVNGKLVAPMFCHDPAAISIMFQIMQDFQPDQIIHLGDILEMASISEWQKKIGKNGMVKGDDCNFYETSWRDSIDMVNVFWEYIAKKHPNASRHQLEGNHDFWSDLFFMKQEVSQFKGQLAFRNLPLWSNLNIEYKQYDFRSKDEGGAISPWIDVGKVRVMHGYKNVSAQRMRLEHDNVIYGHQHKIIYNSWDANSREMRRSWCIGCLTKTSPEYNSMGGQQNGWAQGFAVIHTMPDGKFQVRVVEIQDSCVVDFNGKSYFPKPLGEIDSLLKNLELPVSI